MSGFRVCLAQHSKDLSPCCTTPPTCSLPFLAIFHFSANLQIFSIFGLIFSQPQWPTSRNWPMKNSLKWVSLKWVHWHFSYETVPVPAKIFTKVEFSLKCASLKWVPDCSMIIISPSQTAVVTVKLTGMLRHRVGALESRAESQD